MSIYKKKHCPQTIYLGLGSNLGDRLGNLNSALRFLRWEIIIDAVSSVYETDPIGLVEQSKFLNAVCRANVLLPPVYFLNFVKNIEKEIGRTPSFQNGPRIIDIDILLWENLVLETSDLVIPHPRLLERTFVLVPLLEISPELIHPVTGKKLTGYLRKLNKSGVRKLSEKLDGHLKKPGRKVRKIVLRSDG